MKCPCFFPTAAVAAFLTTVTPVTAQAPSPKPSPAPTTVAEASEKRFDIELSGATAEGAVRLLAEKTGHPVNVIFTGESAGTRLPDLQLQKVTLAEFFAAVKAAGHAEQKAGRQGCEFSAVEGAPNIYTFSVLPPAMAGYRQIYGTATAATAGPAPAGVVIGGTGTGAATPQIVAELPKTATFPAPPMHGRIIGSGGGAITRVEESTFGGGGTSTLFFDLSKILDEELTIEDVTTAIRTGWTAAAGGKEPPAEALKFHQESKLLIASGPPQQLESVTNIVRLLEERRRPSKDEQTLTIESLRARIEEMNEQNQRLEKKLVETEQIREASVRELRDQIAKLEIELAKRGKPQ
jgi:hypothetical protein